MFFYTLLSHWMENEFDEEFESADDESFEEVRLNNEKTQWGAFFLYTYCGIFIVAETTISCRNLWKILDWSYVTQIWLLPKLYKFIKLNYNYKLNLQINDDEDTMRQITF
jgi:hypothetical protein